MFDTDRDARPILVARPYVQSDGQLGDSPFHRPRRGHRLKHVPRRLVELFAPLSPLIELPEVVHVPAKERFRFAVLIEHVDWRGGLLDGLRRRLGRGGAGFRSGERLFLLR